MNLQHCNLTEEEDNQFLWFHFRSMNSEDVMRRFGLQHTRFAAAAGKMVKKSKDHCLHSILSTQSLMAYVMAAALYQVVNWSCTLILVLFHILHL